MPHNRPSPTSQSSVRETFNAALERELSIEHRSTGGAFSEAPSSPVGGAFSEGPTSPVGGSFGDGPQSLVGGTFSDGPGRHGGSFGDGTDTGSFPALSPAGAGLPDVA